MSDDELEGVIAHELSHVRNYDILISSIAATLAGAITYLAQMGHFAAISDMATAGTMSAVAADLPLCSCCFLAPLAAMLCSSGFHGNASTRPTRPEQKWSGSNLA